MQRRTSSSALGAAGPRAICGSFVREQQVDGDGGIQCRRRRRVGRAVRRHAHRELDDGHKGAGHRVQRAHALQRTEQAAHPAILEEFLTFHKVWHDDERVDVGARNRRVERVRAECDHACAGGRRLRLAQPLRQRDARTHSTESASSCLSTAAHRRVCSARRASAALRASSSAVAERSAAASGARWNDARHS